MNVFDKVSIGQMVSLVFALMVVALVIVFFVKRKSPALTAIYGVAMVIFLGIFVASWFVEGLELARALAVVIAVAMIAIVAVVYSSDFKSWFFSLSKKGDKKQRQERYTNEELQHTIEEIVKACQTMSKARTGALIVIAPTKMNENIIDSGVRVEAILSASLLESIFNTKAPMHDGAVIVKGSKVVAAGCFLPLTQNPTLPKELGTRHRAAVGITEECDNLSIVVSEENGIISIVRKGVLRKYITPERLSDMLYEIYGVSARMKR